MRGKFSYIDHSKSKFWVKIWWKCRNRLPKFEISIFGKFGFEEMRNRDIKTWNSISILHFGDRNSKSIPKTPKSAPQNLKFDFDLEFLGQEIDFENLKIIFSNSFRISIWDLKIWNRQRRKPLNLHFRIKILIFVSNFSSTKILILY